MKTKIIVPLLIALIVISHSGCFGNDKATYIPTNYPDSIWKAEEIDMTFKVAKYNDENVYDYPLAKYKTGEKEYYIWVCFAIGRGFSVEFVDLELMNTFPKNEMCVLARGNCKFRENKLVVKLEKNDIFGDIKKITFIKQDRSDLQNDIEFDYKSPDVFSKEDKSNWICDSPAAAFYVDHYNYFNYKADFSLKDKTIETAVVFGLQSKIYFLDLSKYKTPSDRFNATVIEGNYEYNDDTLVVHVEASTVLNDAIDTLTFKKTEVPEDNGENSEEEKLYEKKILNFRIQLKVLGMQLNL